VKEKLGEVEIYSDVIDVLISPSNVRNFSDAINDKLVTIPDIIAKRVSNINKGATRLVDSLQKLLQSVLVQEREVYTAKFFRLREQFGRLSSIEEQKLVAIFAIDSAERNLGEYLGAVDKALSELPSEELRLEIFKQKELPEFKNRLSILREAKRIPPEEVDLKGQTEMLAILSKNCEAIKDVHAGLRNLPTRENIAALQDFAIPSIKSFDLEVLLNSQRIGLIIEDIETARKNLETASELAEAQSVPLKLGEIVSLASSYKQLLKAVKSPSAKPKGDDAVITYLKEEKESRVFLPIGALVKNPDYLRGIESTPSVYQTTALSGKQLEAVIGKVKAKTEDLEKCRAKLKLAIDFNEASKKLVPSLLDEIRYLDGKKIDTERKLRSILSRWENGLVSLTNAFGIKPFQYNLDTVEGIRKFVSAFEPILKESESILIGNLKSTLAQFGVAVAGELDTEKITLDDLLKKQSEEILSKREKLVKIRDWTNSNMREVKETEDKLVTIRLLETAISVLSAIMERIRAHTSYEAMAEQVAKHIEENVRNCAQLILPEEMVEFRHVGRGNFIIQTLAGEPVTHPAGSHKAVISLSIMLTLSQLFDLPLILDEATDRFDYVTLRNTFQFVSMLAKNPTSPQICFVSYKTLNIEMNPDIVDMLKDWNIYLLQRQYKLEKDIVKVTDVNAIVAA
jgi:hypothetical protein